MSEAEVNTIIREPTLSKKEMFFYYNTLTCLVKSLEGKCTTIDLRNECYVTGMIVMVDGQMNIEMEDVIFYNSRGEEHVFPSFFLKQRNIRYVHIPKWIPTQKLIEMQLSKMSRPRVKLSKQKPSFKTVRAKRYNKEIVQSAYEKDSS